MYTEFTLSGNGFDMVTGSLCTAMGFVNFYGCVTVDGLSYLCNVTKVKGERRKTGVSVKYYDRKTKKFRGSKRYDGDVKKRLQELTIAKYEIFMKLNKPF